MASSKGVAKAVCVKIDNSRFYQINRHGKNQISKFNRVLKKDIGSISSLTVLIMPGIAVDDM